MFRDASFRVFTVAACICFLSGKLTLKKERIRSIKTILKLIIFYLICEIEVTFPLGGLYKKYIATDIFTLFPFS